MKIFTNKKEYILYNDDMRNMEQDILPNSIDSIVCDPPYELNFMGKGWDNTGVAFQKETWEHCFNVLKPGGYLLAFGGSRTFHRIACAIEDAGFEIRDTIMWIYGMGFPKSQNIGKQLEKRLEDEKTKQKTEHDLRLMWERDIQKTMRNEEEQNEVLQSQLQKQSLQVSKHSTSDVWREEPCLEGWNNIQKTERELQRCKVCEMSKRVFINGEERWICNGTQVSDGKTLREMFEQSGSCTSYRSQSEQQQDRELDAIQEQCRTQESREVIEYWNKFGTALKPSFEPIIVARKPFKGILVDNVIEYGVGGINIDECRIETSDDLNGGAYRGKNTKQQENATSYYIKSPKLDGKEYNAPTGRFPANTILTYDETDFEEVCGGFPYTHPAGNKNESNITAGNSIFGIGGIGKRNPKIPGDNGGSASRYFYCAKASKKDRDEGLDGFQEKNIHPTVKPIELMQYLVRLVTPKGGTIMDCFMGSGSTGKAVMFENRERNANYKFIGIELTKEYLPLCETRIDYALNKYEYDEQKQKKEDEENGIVRLF